MTWEHEYDSESDETTIYWNGTEQAVVGGELVQFKNGMPIGPARNAVAQAIQSAGTPERIRMQYDLHYGFDRR